jgi:hypothetical protein
MFRKRLMMQVRLPLSQLAQVQRLLLPLPESTQSRYPT